MTKSERKPRKGLKMKTKKTLWCYAILSTQLIGLLVFTLYPMIWAASKSFYYYSGAESQTRFTGLHNYVTLLQDSNYWESWKLTLLFAVGKLPIELPLAMILAILLTRGLKGSGFFRSLYYLPCVVSSAVVGLAFSCMFDYFGFFNGVMTKLGLMKLPVEWFSSQKNALIVILVGAVWNTFGTNVLYFMSALANVPKELYESAKLDGANSWVQFWHISVPLMGPVLQTILLLAINGTLHTQDYILAITNGAPYGSTHTVMSYLAYKFLPGFSGEVNVTINIGYGCAANIITSIIMVFVALGYTKISKKLRDVY